MRLWHYKLFPYLPDRQFKYLVRMRNIENNEAKFEELTGYVEKLVNPLNSMKTTYVAYSKDDYGFWHSTHIESGTKIIDACSTKKQCIEETHKISEAVFIVIHTPYIKNLIKELKAYKEEHYGETF